MDLSVLESALSGISEIGKKEITFDVGGTLITLRTLLPDEEIQVQKLARGLLQVEEDDVEPDQATVMSFLDEYRCRALAYSIVAVGELNFRGEDFVYTGELLPNGKRIKIPKHEAVTGILKKFSRGILTAIFTKYTELSEMAEKEAEASIDFKVTDSEAEIQRLNDRIVALKAAKTGSPADASVKRIRGLASGKAASPESPSEPDTQVSPELQPESPTPPAQPRQAVAPPQVEPLPVREEKPDEDQVVSSFGEGAEAVQRESERLQKERISMGAPPPHLQAKETAREVFEPDGQIGGVDVFRMPTQDLSFAKGQGPKPEQQNQVDASNPKFKPAK